MSADDKLDGEYFCELMQMYRNAPLANQAHVREAFEDVKRFIRTHFTAKESK